MKITKLIFFTLIMQVLSLMPLCIWANSNSSIEFKHISTDLGLSQKTVQSIFQDSQGFIWIGTQEGLNRYDGREIRVFTNIQDDITSLSSNVIRAIIEDDSGNLWVATSGGLNRFDRHSQSFERINLYDEQGNQVTKLYSLLNMDNGSLLVGTDGNGVYRVNNNNGIYSGISAANLSSLSNADIRVIFKDSRERTWYGTDGQGVFLTDSNGKITSHYSADGSSGAISHNRIRAIIEDSKGQIWFGTRGGGLNRFDERMKSFFSFQHNPNDAFSLSNNRVYKILEDKQRRLWIATDGGVNLLESDAEYFTRIEHHTSQPTGLSHNRVLTLLESDAGLIWLGTMSGLDLWDPVTAKFVHYRNISEDPNSLSNNTVYGLAESVDHQIYVATFGGGLNVYDLKKNQWTTISKQNSKLDSDLENRLMSLMVDNQQRVWVGSFSTGVSVLSNQHKTLKQFSHDAANPSSLSANGITDILQDSDGDIWIATYSAGLNKLNPDQSSFTHFRAQVQNKRLLSDNVLQILEDDEGYIWLATDGGGVARLDKDTNEIISFVHDPLNKNSLTGNSAWSIFQDSRGRFWIGTQGKGLNRWEPENRRNRKNIFQRYTVEDGLPSSTVNGVLEDSQGTIWISTNKGVSRLDPETDQFTHYNLALEIHDNELNQGSILKASDGRLYFGGLNGISAFYPNEITSNLNQPKVVLTNILSENKSVNLDSSLSELNRITFTHKDYLITFEFAALDYSQPEKNQYQYKLDGFDPDWVDSKNFNRATYTNLPSGHYLFKVKGSNNDGLWSEESVNLPVIIQPAPWATWWAFAIYSILFCGFIILLIRTQAARIANQDLFKQQVLSEIETSTRTFNTENASLKEKLRSYEINSANDIDTGLPNQNFFTEQVAISLAFLQKQWHPDFKIKLYCIILKVDCEQAELGTQLSTLADQISTNQASVHLVARWSIDEIAILGFSESITSLKEIVSGIRLSIQNNIADNKISIGKYSMGYSNNPLSNNDDNSFKWENVLMLTEHAARTADNETNKSCIGLIASHQSLTPATVKSIMSETGVSALEDRFEILAN